MKKIYRFGRILIAFIPASYFTNLFYHDLFVTTQHNKLLFLVWAFPCLHLVFVCMQLITMITGRQYQRYEEFTIVSTYPVLKHKIFGGQGRLKRFFFEIYINNRRRIVNGLFWHSPSSILVYKDTFDKLRTFTLSNLLLKVVLILGNVTLLLVLKFFIIKF